MDFVDNENAAEFIPYHKYELNSIFKIDNSIYKVVPSLFKNEGEDEACGNCEFQVDGRKCIAPNFKCWTPDNIDTIAILVDEIPEE